MNAPSQAPGEPLGPIDYDLHGWVGIRLLDARPHDARAVARQLGPFRATLTREPDLTIRFVDQLHLTSPLRYLGADECAFTEDAFLVVQSQRGRRTRCRIPIERIGEPCEIVCESGVPSVPLLIAMINTTALAKGIIPLHASAFVHRGKGVLVTGWSKGGKTEALLAFASEGAEYLGDEWIYLASDGSRMYGIPQPIRLWDWHLEQFPKFRERLGRRAMTRLQAMRGALAMVRALNSSSGAPAALDRVQAILGRQTYVDAEPERVFGPRGSLSGPIDRVFLVGSAATTRVEVRPIESAEVARRMVHSVQYEFQRLMSHYYTFRFAFPAVRNERLDELETSVRQGLQQALRDRSAYVVEHAYPLTIATLFDAMDPLL